MTNKLYEEITKRIIEKLEAGTSIFEMPFSNGLAKNYITKKPYRGVNAIILESGEYATFKQIKDCGGKIKKGAKSETIVFWKLIEAEDEETGETFKTPYARQYKVFKIGRDTEGLETETTIDKNDSEQTPVESTVTIINNYPNKPGYTEISGQAYYNPGLDVVNVPPATEFKEINRYYSTFFHELVHSTGSADRLKRIGITNTDKFGSEQYSKEELVAELGASMLCAVSGIEKHTLDQSASYIKSWIKVLKDDYSFIVSASQQAQKAVDHILNK